MRTRLFGPYGGSLTGHRRGPELVGTSLLVLVGAGGGVVNAVSGAAIERSAAVVAPALLVLALIFARGAVSGAHLIPVVTIAICPNKNWGIP